MGSCSNRIARSILCKKRINYWMIWAVWMSCNFQNCLLATRTISGTSDDNNNKEFDKKKKNLKNHVLKKSFEFFNYVITNEKNLKYTFMFIVARWKSKVRCTIMIGENTNFRTCCLRSHVDKLFYEIWKKVVKIEIIVQCLR